MDPRLAAFVVAQAAAGLHHAHNLTDPLGNPLGLVHRDVSPQNILISFEGSVKVIDFGIARALGRITETQTGGMKGKFGYMSPEQARGEDVDLRTDIFALGVVLWEALTNRRLFQRENDLATMRALAYEPIPRPSTVADVSPELESLVMRALARNPKLRFANGREMASALEKWVVQEGGTSASDLGALVKGLFVADHTSWQQTLRTAVNLPAVTEADLAGPPAPAVPITNSGVQSAPRRWPLFAMSAAALGAALASFVFARSGPPHVDAPPPSALSSPAGVKVLGPAPVIEPSIAPLPAPVPVEPTPTPPPEEGASLPGTPGAPETASDPSKSKSTSTSSSTRKRRPKPPGKPGAPADRRPNPF
ncbi:MAG TPA: serine/threonine-protein kinase, partial [Polyangia bacterium]